VEQDCAWCSGCKHRCGDVKFILIKIDVRKSNKNNLKNGLTELRFCDNIYLVIYHKQLVQGILEQYALYDNTKYVKTY